jgi:hypothetical protein
MVDKFPELLYKAKMDHRVLLKAAQPQVPALSEDNIP